MKGCCNEKLARLLQMRFEGESDSATDSEENEKQNGQNSSQKNFHLDQDNVRESNLPEMIQLIML